MLPSTLAFLDDLANNLWWSWDTEATALWERLDPWRWEQTRHNPVALLRDVEPERLDALARDEDYLKSARAVHARFLDYLRGPNWASQNVPQLKEKCIAYFSMEYGLHESLRLYSGGLGVLAGDHLRSASDLGIPLVAVGLLYREGYFRQVIDDGKQVPAYPQADFRRLPLKQVRTKEGTELQVAVPLEGRRVLARVWRLDVGRVPLYLLDADLEANTNDDRELTRHLYGGNTWTRIAQEVLLGLGGVRALVAAGHCPDLLHLNEGHCAFAPLQLLADRLAQGQPYTLAIESLRQRVVFTTHTPVPAGHDRFGWEHVNRALGPWRESLGLPPGAFMDLGRVQPGNVDEPLCMTVLALRCASLSNGVSALHGEVSRKMWQSLWPDRPVEEVPIGHVTNGVHPTFWCAPAARKLFDEVVPAWRQRPWDPEVWQGLDEVRDPDLWALRNDLRSQLVRLVAQRTGRQLDPAALTIGFARRFAPYKRGDLLFSDPERTLNLLEQGFQVIYSGKAHPQDQLGREIVQRVLSLANDRRFRDRVVFLEDYDMVLGRALTAGCDLWLNNPRRPREASGTSGQKACLNGGINLSILDGWWPEAYDGTNGFAIGGGLEWPDGDEHAQDAADAEDLYRVLGSTVLPEWTTRVNETPERWVQRVRRSIQVGAPLFNSHRMVLDYWQQVYRPLL